MSKSREFRHKSIRDPLYGFIGLSETETKIIDTQVFKRLHAIKQLSHAYVVYPSAIHTRFEHSLGCNYIANEMCEELEVTGEEKKDVRLAALLHDVGHGPYSHLFEHIIQDINPELEGPHEKISTLIVNEDADLDGIIRDRKKSVVEILNSTSESLFADAPKSLLSNIVSGGIDADKLDYLRRDSYHIGVAYGQFDLDRILQMIKRTPRKKTRIGIDTKGKDALENYRLGRYLMHAQVYEHHTRLAADQMFLQALDIAINEEDVIDKKLLRVKDSDNEEFLKFYLSLDDNSIYHDIISSDKSKISREILLNIKKRKLLKRACEFTPKSLKGEADASDYLRRLSKDKLHEIAEEVAQGSGLEKHEVIFHKSEIDIKLFEEGEILILKDGRVDDFQEESPISAEANVTKYYVYAPDDTRKQEKIAKGISDVLQVSIEHISRFRR